MNSCGTGDNRYIYKIPPSKAQGALWKRRRDFESQSIREFARNGRSYTNNVSSKMTACKSLF